MTLLDEAIAGARKVGQGFTEPDDDWLPILMHETPQGRLGIAPIDMSDKDGAALQIAKAIAFSGATEAALITSAWTVSRGKDAPDDGVAPSKDPYRMEALVITYIAPKVTKMATAAIMRDGANPPMLSDFDVIEGDDSVAGRFAHAMRAGMDLARE